MLLVYLKSVSNLTSLRVLDLSSTLISGNMPSFITSLKSLEYLSLVDTEIEGSFSFSLLANHSKLEVFRVSSMSDNFHVETESPPWLPTFQLKAIQLERCHLNAQQNSSIPSFLLFQKELRLVDLSHNNLQGNFPSWLFTNNSKLETLHLTNNSFNGTLQLPTSKHSLQSLQISSNKIGGQLPDNIGNIFNNLFHVNLSMNNLEGTLPSSMVEMQRVQILDLSHNNFRGELARNFFSNWTSLMLLSLSHNNFSGQVIPRFAQSAKLQFLLLNDNNFTGEMYDGVLLKSSLQAMDISGNMVSGRIPSWIGNFSSLQLLSLSKNILEGEIRLQICGLKSITYLDLSENGLSGSIPSCMANLTMLKFCHLQKNALTGLTSIGIYALYSLDLRGNEFSGDVSSFVGTFIGEDVTILLLGGNKLSGSIPHRLCKFMSLRIMDLSRNRLNGKIPSCLGNISFAIDHGNCDGTPISNNFCFGETFNVWFFFETAFTLYNSTLILYNNSLDDYYVVRKPIPTEFRTKNNVLSYTGYVLEKMSGLDLSSNELSGNIPHEMGNIVNLNALNLSHNCLSGSIPSKLSNLVNVESLDLSYNNLSGEIPLDMTKLNFLAIFNVSYNNLSGLTPTTGQFANFGEDNYRGNPNLFGFPKRNSTRIFSPPPPPTEIQSNEGGENHPPIELVSFFWGFVSSYVLTVLSLAIVLWFSPRWCRAWFWLVDLCIYYCCLFHFRNGFR
ncbi:receptor-like protein 14 [Abrus precatorius]|uniref:Receptor-like protein 14 n=1 Tax=Abrus precatorius TaxID=3816 RepID=A0A8B8K9C6_ABRPR|nr:receptor-like protein 14 [Abrus precatorius]